MANERTPIQRGLDIKDEVVLTIGRQSFDGWQSLSISKNLESIANQFSINLFDKFEGLRQNWPLKPGVKIKISINRQAVFTGTIEKLGVEYSNDNRTFVISGRSNAGDLVDCMHIGPNEYKNITLLALAKELVRPFDITVFTSVVAPNLISTFAVKPSETVFEALDRAARLQGLFFISTREGNIRLTRAARARSFSTLEQDVNILSATADYDDSQRFADYTVKGQSSGLDNFSGVLASGAQGTAKDLAVTRHRPLTILAEGNVDNAKAKERAQWEASSRLAKAIKITAVVQGWIQEDGSLWGINQVTPFKSSFLGLNRDLLITNIEHVDSQTAGKTTTISLTDTQAYSLSPVLNSTSRSNLLSDIGAGF